MQCADGEGQGGFLCFHDTIYAWDVDNTWLISLIWISSCRQMNSIRISNIRRYEKALWLWEQ
jgi:hypothetical protein